MTGEFSRRTENLLDRAETICEHRGANLTELRRHVLGLILDAASPTGAYELLDRLRQNAPRCRAAHRVPDARFPARTGPDPPGGAVVGLRRLRGGLHGRPGQREPYPRGAVPDLPRVRPGGRDAGPPRFDCLGARREGRRLQHPQCDDRGGGPVQHVPRGHRWARPGELTDLLTAPARNGSAVGPCKMGRQARDGWRGTSSCAGGGRQLTPGPPDRYVIL